MVCALTWLVEFDYSSGRESMEDAHESSDEIDEIELLVIGLFYCRYELSGGKDWFY